MGVLDDAIREHLELKRRHGADPVDVARLEREALGPVTAAELEIADDEGQWADEPEQAGAAYDADPHATALMEQPPTEAYQAPPEAAAPPPPPATAPPVFHPPVADAPPPPPPAAPPAAAPPSHDATVPPPPPAAAPTAAARFRDDELDEEFDFTGEIDEPVTGQRPPAPPAPPGGAAPPPPPAAAPPTRPTATPPAPPAAAPPPAPAAPPVAPPAGPPPAAGSAPPPAVAPLPRTRLDDGAPGPVTDQGDTTQGDVLSDTPEFLQETPDHDRLWFEQKPPKDFDF